MGGAEAIKFFVPLLRAITAKSCHVPVLWQCSGVQIEPVTDCRFSISPPTTAGTPRYFDVMCEQTIMRKRPEKEIGSGRLVLSFQKKPVLPTVASSRRTRDFEQCGGMYGSRFDFQCLKKCNFASVPLHHCLCSLLQQVAVVSRHRELFSSDVVGFVVVTDRGDVREGIADRKGASALRG